MRSSSAAVALAAAVLLLIPSSGWAAEVVEVDFQKVLALSRDRSAELAAARGRVAEARGAVSGASAFLHYNPTLQVAAGPRNAPLEGRGLTLELGLSQTFEVAGQRAARRDSAAAGVAAEEARLRNTERLVLGEVAETFVKTLHAQQRIALASTLTRAGEELTQATRRRVEAGELPIVDLNVARIAQARAEAALAAAQGDAALLNGELCRLLALGPAVAVRPLGDLGTLAKEPLPPGTVDPRPDVAALKSDLQQAAAELRFGESAAWPDVTLGVGYEREGQEETLLGALSIPLPLFSRGQEQRVASRARVERLTAAVESTQVARDRQSAAAKQQHELNLNAVRILERDALPLAEDNLSLSRKSYDAGQMDLGEFLVVRREALEARADHLDRLLAAALSRINVLLQGGGFP